MNPTTLVNLGTHRTAGRIRIGADVPNPLNTRDADITCFDASRMQGELAGSGEDRHIHPVDPPAEGFGAR
ncbi:hypothetical protein [Sphingomonas solaris]|uniref:Uncharacterized protein n=1 Tax=Alterirhizorhabdus solaris TaxID=2529389 RepID=A0A558RAC9_9SPHN|nr:hypothetical protein [Sphingomonas solaris]TVV76242.1 hypothetical protein FOY91_04880 [Sphingomonas solaris]